jgi:hypothetical protein
LELLRLGAIDAQTAQLRPSVGRCRGFGPLERRNVAILVAQRERPGAAGGDSAPKGDASGFAGGDAHSASQREHRIEDGAGGVRQRPCIHDTGGIAKFSSPSQKSRPIGLELQCAGRTSFDYAVVEHPERRIARLAAAARRQQGLAVRDELRLHEHFGERRVRRVRGGARQDHLGVARDLDFAHAATAIGNAYAARFGVVFGRDQYLGGGEHRTVGTDDFCAIFVKRRLVGVGLAAERLVSGRPRLAAGDIAQQHEEARRIADRILAPAGHGDVAPAAVAGAGGGNHHAVVVIGQQVRPRRRMVRRIEAA